MQNVGTPRFYVDWFSYVKAIGVSIRDDEYSYTAPVGINPTNITTAEYTAGTDMNVFKFGDNTSIIKPKNMPINFVAILGHNYSGRKLSPHFHNIDDDFNRIDNFNPDFADICNWGSDTDSLNPTHNGFSIADITNMSNGTTNNLGMFSLWQGSTYMPNAAYSYKSGSCIVGNYYDMPHSPDLNLKLTYEYDGVKTIQTKGGATLSNALYTKPADWGDAGAWQLGDVEGQGISSLRSGRRTWDLSFSYLSDTDVFPVNATTYNPLETYPDDDTLLDGTDFFSQVINRTMGGHLPFIFQPDGGGGVEGQGNFNPDQFCIARFDMKSFTYDQVANNVYNVKLKIREVW